MTGFMPQLSNAIKRIKPSPTVALTARVAALRAQGRQIIGLGAGEPDFPTPDHICEAAIDAIRSAKTRYTAPDGIAELKSAIAAKFRRDNDITYTPDEIIVGTGGKQVLFNALMASLNEGDEVLIPAPFWVSYPDIVSLAGAKPVILLTDMASGFKLSAGQLEDALTPKTRWLILNSPGNPTGAVYAPHEISALLDVLKAHPQVMILSDDIYEHLVFGDAKFVSPPTVRPDFKDRTLVLNGVSKAYAMTGWRIGFGCGPAPLIKAMRTLQSQSTTNPCSIAQWAAVAALDGRQDLLEPQKRLFEGRRDRIVAALNEIAGITCPMPDGAFYVFPDLAGVLGKIGPGGRPIETDLMFCESLLEHADVAVVPGTAFGAPGHFRISYAASDDDLAQAMSKIAGFCAGLT